MEANKYGISRLMTLCELYISKIVEEATAESIERSVKPYQKPSSIRFTLGNQSEDQCRGTVEYGTDA